MRFIIEICFTPWLLLWHLLSSHTFWWLFLHFFDQFLSLPSYRLAFLKILCLVYFTSSKLFPWGIFTHLSCQLKSKVCLSILSSSGLFFQSKKQMSIFYLPTLKLIIILEDISSFLLPVLCVNKRVSTSHLCSSLSPSTYKTLLILAIYPSLSFHCY